MVGIRGLDLLVAISEHLVIAMHFFDTALFDPINQYIGCEFKIDRLVQGRVAVYGTDIQFFAPCARYVAWIRE
jgi:hypothetical protein